MSSSETIQGILNNQDLFYPSPNNAAMTTLSDEYELEATVFGQPLTLSLFANDPATYDTFVQVINANNGAIIAQDDDGGNGLNSLISNLTLQGGIDYRIRVTSFGMVSPNDNNAYTLQASVPQGDIILTPRQINAGDSKTGNAVTFNGELNSTDYFFPSPNNAAMTTLSDEYDLEATVFGQPLTLSLFANDPATYDTFVQVINANNGAIIAQDDDGGNGLNSLISNLTLQGGIDYRIRVTSFGMVSPNDNNAYTLQASVPQGELTVTPLTTEPIDSSPVVANPISDVSVTQNAADRVIDLSSVFSDIDLDPITFSVENNSNSGLVTSVINGTDLNLDFQNNQSGTANIIIRATANGQTIDDTFTVNVSPNPTTNNGNGFDTQYYRFQNTDVLGTYIFVDSVERQNILRNFQSFEEEGAAFKVRLTPGDDLVAVNRYQSDKTPGTYLFSTAENFQQDPLINEDDFYLEGRAFYAYGANSGNGTDFYRFENSDRPGTYLFPGPSERSNILVNFTSFEDQGAVWAVET